MPLRPKPGDYILIRYDDMTGWLMGHSFITRDGEAIEGDGVEVFGVVTFPLTICVGTTVPFDDGA